MIDTQIEHQIGWRLVMQNQLDWSNSIHQPVDVSFIQIIPTPRLLKLFCWRNGDKPKTLATIL